MNNTTLQKRVGEWQNSLRSWNAYKNDFAICTQPCDPYTLAWLEGYLRDVYGDVMRPIIEKLKGKPLGQRDWPFVTYLLHVAEQVEPLFKMRLQSVVESFAFSHLEVLRVKSDYLSYLLCGYADEEPAKFIVNLNAEITIVEFIQKHRYSNNAKLKPLVGGMILKSKQCTDMEAKQYIILIALFLEPLYRKRFIPDDPSPERPILAKPKRFFYFVTEILKPLVRRLRNGLISGLSEFVRECRPAYAMID